MYMKRSIALIALLAIACGAAVAQSAFSEKSTELYTVYAEGGQAMADELAAKLDALFGLYNGYFRFDPDTLKANLKVTYFETKAAFDAYLTKIAKETRNDFVFLRYASPEKNELVLFKKENQEDFDASLAHQAFIHFIGTFMQAPPIWIQEGFAIFFEQARYDAIKGAIQFQENMAWLETIKTLKAQGKLYDVEAMLSLSKESYKADLDNLYAQTWILVSFLVNSEDKAYNRLLWDSIALIKRDATYEENVQAILERFRRWHTKEKATADYLAFIDEQKTFPELVNLGIVAYGEKKYAEAKEYLGAAIKKNDQNYAPYYYLGLIAYAENDFALADYYYKSALQLGADAATVNYALGVNAYAANRFEDAKMYLEAAKAADPERYGARVDELLAKIEG
jgi:hypothetical protein